MTSIRASISEHEADFVAFDLNGDGVIDAYEIRRKNPNIGQQDVSSFFIETDKNQDGRITFQEYMHSQYANNAVYGNA